MRILRDPAACDDSCKGAVIALGNFDGVHKGHRAIIAETIHIARTLGAPPAVMTFEPHPREFFTNNREGLRIYNLRRKMALLHECGIELLYLMRFNQQFASTTAEHFVGELLHKTLGAKHIVTGEHFAFGKGRGGDSAFLAEKSRALGMGYTACSAVTDGKEHMVSSSAIRGLLTIGDVKNASIMLGKPYTLCGRVIHGDARGRMMGYPTANILLGGRFRPRFGIYAVRITIDGVTHKGAASLGIRPNFEVTAPLLEVHIFNFNGNLYGKQASVELVDFIRDEQKFDELDALKMQIASDCKEAMGML